MSSGLPPPPPSPGFSTRRKAPPKLPLSLFSPPPSGASSGFPQQPDPSTVHPKEVVDAHVAAPGGDLSRWSQHASEAFGNKTVGVVVSLAGTDPSEISQAIEGLRSRTSEPPVLAILVPFSLDEGAPSDLPEYLQAPSASGPSIVLSTVYTRYTPKSVEALQWALEKGFVVDINIETNLRAGEGAWEDLEEFLVKAIPESHKGKIILSNILPPPDDLSLPIVKLLTHPTYQQYQTQTAALSLYANISIKFTPPAWAQDGGAEAFDKKEWKKRVKMYIGPAAEAFGCERILFGSSPSPSSRAPVTAGDWYELARGAFAEMGFEQQGLDAIFAENARRVYTTSS